MACSCSREPGRAPSGAIIRRKRAARTRTSPSLNAFFVAKSVVPIWRFKPSVVMGRLGLTLWFRGSPSRTKALCSTLVLAQQGTLRGSSSKSHIIHQANVDEVVGLHQTGSLEEKAEIAPVCDEGLSSCDLSFPAAALPDPLTEVPQQKMVEDSESNTTETPFPVPVVENQLAVPTVVRATGHVQEAVGAYWVHWFWQDLITCMVPALYFLRAKWYSFKSRMPSR